MYLPGVSATVVMPGVSAISECMDSNGTMILQRTVLRHRAKGKPILTYTERFRTVPVQSPHVDAANLLKYQVPSKLKNCRENRHSIDAI